MTFGGRIMILGGKIRILYLMKTSDMWQVNDNIITEGKTNYLTRCIAIQTFNKEIFQVKSIILY
jgi:hypothetical protein